MGPRQAAGLKPGKFGAYALQAAVCNNMLVRPFLSKKR